MPRGRHCAATRSFDLRHEPIERSLATCGEDDINPEFAQFKRRASAKPA